MWLLAHHNPTTYGWAARPPATAPDMSYFPVEHARGELPALVGTLADVTRADCAAEMLVADDFDDMEDPGPRA